jgi:ribosomal protein L12E/L44/L45/RPP1/RPP2
MEDAMSGYVIARENFKEASRHVSAEQDPVMFNLLYGLQSLTDQIEAEFAALRSKPAAAHAAAPAKTSKKTKAPAKKTPAKKKKARR